MSVVSKARVKCSRPDMKQKKEMARVGRGMNQDTLPKVCRVNPGLISFFFVGIYPAQPSLFLIFNNFFFFLVF